MNSYERIYTMLVNSQGLDEASKVYGAEGGIEDPHIKGGKPRSRRSKRRAESRWRGKKYLGSSKGVSKARWAELQALHKAEEKKDKDTQ